MKQTKISCLRLKRNSAFTAIANWGYINVFVVVVVVCVTIHLLVISMQTSRGVIDHRSTEMATSVRTLANTMTGRT